MEEQLITVSIIWIESSVFQLLFYDRQNITVYLEMNVVPSVIAVTFQILLGPDSMRHKFVVISSVFGLDTRPQYRETI